MLGMQMFVIRLLTMFTLSMWPVKAARQCVCVCVSVCGLLTYRCRTWASRRSIQSLRLAFCWGFWFVYRTGASHLRPVCTFRTDPSSRVFRSSPAKCGPFLCTTRDNSVWRALQLCYFHVPYVRRGRRQTGERCLTGWTSC